MVLRLLALQLHALGAELGEHTIDALLLNRAQAGGRNAQRYPALFGLDPETLCMQVGQEATTPLVVRVRDAITDCRPLAGDLADAGHTNQPREFSNLCGAQRYLAGGRPHGVGLYTSTCSPGQDAHSSPCSEKE